MQGRGRADEGDVCLGQGIAVRLFPQPAQQQFRNGADVDHVQAALVVSELDDVAQNADHRVADLFLLIHLLGHHLHQALLLGVEHQGVAHPAADHAGIERPGDVVAGPQVIGAFDEGIAILGGDHNDRGLLDPVILVHGLQHTKAVYLRHGDVQQQQIDLRVAVQQLHGLLSVLRFQKRIVFLAQDLHQDHPVQGGVIYDQYGFFVVHTFILSLDNVTREKRFPSVGPTENRAHRAAS